jgi:hypothetical protein
MWKELCAFIASAKDHWRELTGGSLAAVLLSVAASMGLNAPPIITGLFAFGLVVVCAAFLAWRDQYRKVQELKLPCLRGYVISVGIGRIEGGAGITVLLQITNIGPPTIADDFTAIVQCGGGRKFELHPIFLPPNSTFSDEAGNVVKIDESDMLYERLVTPIPEGGRISGFLFYLLKDRAAVALLTKGRSDITIFFRDASLRKYQTTNKGAPESGQPIYEPGVRDPFIALNSGKVQASEAEKGKAMFEACLRKIRQGEKPLKALQDVNAHELETNADLIRFCSTIEQHGEQNPCEKIPITQPYWLSFLKFSVGADLTNPQEFLRISQKVLELVHTGKPPASPDSAASSLQSS